MMEVVVSLMTTTITMMTFHSSRDLPEGQWRSWSHSSFAPHNSLRAALCSETGKYFWPCAAFLSSHCSHSPHPPGTWSWTTSCWTPRVTASWRTLACARRASWTGWPPPPSVARRTTSLQRWGPSLIIVMAAGGVKSLVRSFEVLMPYLQLVARAGLLKRNMHV